MDEQNILTILNWVGTKEPTVEILSKVQAVYNYNNRLNMDNIWYCIISTYQKRKTKKNFKVITKTPVSKEETMDIGKQPISWLTLENMDISYVYALEDYEKSGGIIIRQ